MSSQVDNTESDIKILENRNHESTDKKKQT